MKNQNLLVLGLFYINVVINNIKMRIGTIYKTLSLLWVLTNLQSPVRANMAAPLLETKSHSAIASKDLHILNETIYLKINQAGTGNYRITYNIRSDESGIQIPFLFHALDFGHDKILPKVTLDGKPVALAYVDSALSQTQMAALLQKFSQYAPAQSNQQSIDSFIKIYWCKDKDSYSGYNSNSDVYSLKELIYFQLDITPGIHQIVVEYAASPCNINDGSGTESFRYALQPARYWKSFGGMVFTLDASEICKSKNITVTLGKPHKGSFYSLATWEFKNLPADYFHVVIALNQWDKFIYTGILGWFFCGIVLFLTVLIQYRRIRKLNMTGYTKPKNSKLFIKLMAYFIISSTVTIIFFIILSYSGITPIGIMVYSFFMWLIQFSILFLSDILFNKLLFNKNVEKQT